mmetsp:Transcript_31151/g.92848  ORF Transcript_31151/g.92848 Transcript_31151/m.92848 type:complete len:410 (-) Transcript_31151:1569-2798(-)
MRGHRQQRHRHHLADLARTKLQPPARCRKVLARLGRPVLGHIVDGHCAVCTVAADHDDAGGGALHARLKCRQLKHDDAAVVVIDNRHGCRRLQQVDRAVAAAADRYRAQQLDQEHNVRLGHVVVDDADDNVLGLLARPKDQLPLRGLVVEAGHRGVVPSGIAHGDGRLQVAMHAHHRQSRLVLGLQNGHLRALHEHRRDLAVKPVKVSLLQAGHYRVRAAVAFPQQRCGAVLRLPIMAVGVAAGGVDVAAHILHRHCPVVQDGVLVDGAALTDRCCALVACGGSAALLVGPPLVVDRHHDRVLVRCKPVPPTRVDHVGGPNEQRHERQRHPRLPDLNHVRRDLLVHDPQPEVGPQTPGGRPDEDLEVRDLPEGAGRQAQRAHRRDAKQVVRSGADNRARAELTGRLIQR